MLCFLFITLAHLPADFLVQFLYLGGLQLLLVFEKASSGCIQQLQLLDLQLSLHGCQPDQSNTVVMQLTKIKCLIIF